MASKEAIVYVVDLGSTVGDCHNGRTEDDLEYSLKYVWNKIGNTMSANRATWSVGVVGFRTEDTNNELDEEDYSNISILKKLGPMEMDDLSDLRKKLVTNDTETGDAMGAIVVAIDMITKFTTLKTGKLGKFSRKIILVTDGQGSMDDSDIDCIAQQINEVGIELVILGTDFDDADFGFKEEDKSKLKRKNETIFRRLTELCDKSVFGTVAEALESISSPQAKTTRPYSVYEGKLGLGDFDKYEASAMSIDVKRFFRTKLAKPVSASSVVVRVLTTNGEGSAQYSHTKNADVEMTDAPDVALVRNARKYEINDPLGPKGKRDVERDDLAKGYEYGRTAVHISESDENITRLETIQSFSIIGFIPSPKYERYLDMGESCITIAQTVNDKARMALSSLVHALHELESYAVARIVPKDGKNPQLILLAPSIEPDLEALIDVPLPFAEDVRMYRFPPLDKVFSSTGAILPKHRNLPSSDLIDAMSNYVDSMDLSVFGEDDDGKPAEYMPIEETYSPIVHRVKDAIMNRALYPKQNIQPPADVLMKWSHPPVDLLSKAAPELENLRTTAGLIQVPAKVKGKRGFRETIKPRSGLDIDALLSQEKRQKITAENAVPEFKQMIVTSTDDGVIKDAATQMSEIIRGLIKNGRGHENKIDQAIEHMTTFKACMIDADLPDLYNYFIRDLKQMVVRGELNIQSKSEFWYRLKAPKLGLIDKDTHDASKVSEQEAKDFYFLDIGLPTRIKTES